MSGRMHGLKRRDPDDLVLDLQNVSLSPSKKLRVYETGVSSVPGSGSIFTTPQPAGEAPFSLLKALDLSGGPSIPLGQKRLNRVSSCPRFSSAMDDLPMIEEIDDKAAQQLQVIPWVPNSTAALLAGTKPIIEEIDDVPLTAPEMEEMADGESMEVVSEDIIVPEVDTTTMGGQFGSPLPTFSAAPWQQCETLQPPFTKVMWSH
ncbi:hypothetical protein Mapa_011069 [Marchantia paleacea]|nr:hypothetical protein Mapa_011069 [Marchantia paleacea]